MSIKLKETLKELADRSHTFFTCEEQIREKNKEIAKLEANLKSTTQRMEMYDLERKNLQMRMFHTDDKVKHLTETNEQMSAMIEKLDHLESKRDRQLVEEFMRNEKMQEALFEAEDNLFKAETTTLFVMQNNIKDGEIRVNKLENDLANLQLAKEQDRRFHKEEKLRMHK